ncbi:MAG: threonine synthase [Omnitrophica bacterium RIFCSPLOWO2_12_FULL_44_17]|uniref:Threonine synthase n=1 Tax=Candidatus Danuiimicrobium aquiferis TaxID=1801832 RepID=A0A1G1L233_9BACT|nr:MAG: threonine synthase [Omnitrophica bacterium RIFCSPHIGHO2_02_FULL_45_28]OGW99205.1 MAG: threonine synthase [Omnitrophica bacterium RIFCSPLOWO2_12_FULL_44_17]OGX03178.1 MAG: threonine synthase [Omnitrophica bacterium RIFCSPLOWO2_02_FULL_44_11]
MKCLCGKRDKKIGVIERYQEFLPVSSKTPIVSLNEGNTPLILSEVLPRELGLRDIRLYFKFEGLNPTGSFKDRGMTMAVTKAFEKGSKAIICASTGNTSASAAAYASRCGMKCIVLIPEGKIAKGKLVQAFRYGAKVIIVKGNFDEALDLVRKIGETQPIEIVNSINPFRIEGQKTASFEIIDDLGDAPDYHVLPVGNAGNITAYWRGYKEYFKIGRSTQKPKMLGFQAVGAAPIVLNQIVEHPETIATAIRIGNPASWQGAVAARDESEGVIDSVTDEEITWAYRFIAEREGVFAEPASCAGVAGIRKLAGAGYFKPGTRIVCTLTGNGLKDPEFALGFDDRMESVKATLNDVMKVIES